eukprot:Skav211061  [mRNA]  locus=scaffold314:89953:93480:- [translate_table: standard]
MLFFKAWITAAEPLQFKGGHLHAISKRPGRMTLENVRGIMMLSSLGKLYHGVMRRRLVDSAEVMRSPTQLGGFKGQQTGFGVLMLRTYTKIAAARSVSVTTLFVDVKHAFHALLRQHAFSGASDMPPKLLETLGREGLDPQALLQDAQRHSELFRSTVPLQTARVVEEAHRATWFTMQGDVDMDKPACGSRPGSPMADMAFNVLMSSVVSEVEAYLLADDGIARASTAVGMAAPAIVWADDLALSLPSPTAVEVKPMLCRLVPGLIRILNGYGLLVNLKPGKTEAVVTLHGKDAPKVQQEILMEDFSQLMLPSGERLRLVSSYQHLGTTFVQALSIRAEVQHRIHLARGAFRQLSRKLLLCRKLPVRLRLQLFEALIVPIALYGCGTWPLLSASLYRTLKATLVGWQRSIADIGHWSDQRVSDDEFRALHRLPALSLRLSKHRLLTALQMQRNAPTILFDLLSAEDQFCKDSWLNALRHGLRWYVNEVGEEHQLAGRELTVPTIYAWLAGATHLEAHAIRRQVRRRLLEEETIHDVASFHRQAARLCEEHGAVLSEPTSEDAPVGSFPCHLCHETFSSIQGLTAHKWKKHNLRSQERQYMTSTTCNACRRCFWSAQRLQQHLKRSRQLENGCYHYLVQHMDPVDPATAAGLVEIPPHLQRVHRLPAVPALGPAPLPGLTCWERHHQARRDLVDAQWQHFGYPASLPAADRERLGLAFDDTLRTFDTVSFAYDDDSLALSWLALIDQEDIPDVGLWALIDWGTTSRYDLVETFDNVDFIAYVDEQFQVAVNDFPMWQLLTERDFLARQRPPDPPVPELPSDAPDLRLCKLREPFPDRYLQQISFLAPWTMRTMVLAPELQQMPLVEMEDGSRWLYILHLFSGRRRAGDCHDWVEVLGPQIFQDLNIRVKIVSVDTAVSGHGDLLGVGFRNAYHLCRLGMVGLSLTGPPCETWTSARHLACPERPSAPRPLRCRSRAWGLAHLTLSELRQLSTGSALLCRSLIVELLVVLAGGGCLMEHPAPPLQDDHATTWATEIQTNYLGRLPFARTCHFSQYRFGALSVKPTTFRVAGLPGFASLFYNEQEDYDRPTTHLGGWNIYDRCYRTAAAKEYPPKLCRAMVWSTLNVARKRIAREGARVVPWTSLPERERSWLNQLASAALELSHEFMPDYQPRPGDM